MLQNLAHTDVFACRLHQKNVRRSLDRTGVLRAQLHTAIATTAGLVFTVTRPYGTRCNTYKRKTRLTRTLASVTKNNTNNFFTLFIPLSLENSFPGKSPDGRGCRASSVQCCCREAERQKSSPNQQEMAVSAAHALCGPNKKGVGSGHEPAGRARAASIDGSGSEAGIWQASSFASIKAGIGRSLARFGRHGNRALGAAG